MSFESAVTFFLAILLFGITPGPGVFAIIARALVKGTKDCVMLALGMTISDILYLIAACFGLATIATHWSEVFTAIRIIGALYLLYLGYKMWTSPVDLNQTDAQEEKPKGMGLSFLQGFLISASNPKVILFYIAFLPTFMDVTALGGNDIILASVLTLFGLMIGLMGIALFASRARVLFKSERATKRLNRGAGSVMMGAGLYLASSD